MAETTSVVVVGAGPAGLAVGACLRKAGVDFTILEKENRVASSWRRHYERLHLHTIKQFSSLPFLPFPKNYPRYVPRDQMVEYLDSYAKNFNLQPRFGEAVRLIRRDANEWVVESTSLSIRAPFIVIASGYSAEPVKPIFSGTESFKGKLLHASAYTNAKPFTGQSVLVIGMGNTGAEIALDLAEHGAHPTISLRDGVHIVPRDLFGIPVQMVAMFATKALPLGANDRIFPIILDLVLGDLTKYGIKRPKEGLMQQIRTRARIPVLDVGTVRKITEGAIKIAPGISRITDDGAVFVDESDRKFDAIIVAAGYRPNYQSFFTNGDLQRVHGDVPDGNSGIYLVGFRNSVTGLLREISRGAMRIADDIARRRPELAHRSN
ncbi:MAG TPA: NAD(P)/FAD-dependent oxidoreductase [Xanthobacteraceae bacterium]|nr:NAD(P)/FAD-dependent oxidoreductase [Xanthobacteraceae bacterium]